VIRANSSSVSQALHSLALSITSRSTSRCNRRCSLRGERRASPITFATVTRFACLAAIASPTQSAYYLSYVPILRFRLLPDRPYPGRTFWIFVITGTCAASRQTNHTRPCELSWNFHTFPRPAPANLTLDDHYRCVTIALHPALNLRGPMPSPRTTVGVFVVRIAQQFAELRTVAARTRRQSAQRDRCAGGSMD
jgi:hypothetical protein